MNARHRLFSGLVAILLAAIGLIAGGAVPASAHQSGNVKYVALGDSYAAGQGAGNYRNECLQSRNGYPELLDEVKHVNLHRNATCTGATTADVIADQVSALDPRTTLVTLTVGGNDLRVAAIAAACAAGPTVECQTAIAGAVGMLSPQPQLGGLSILGSRLLSTYSAVAANAPNAEILVTGYPYLFEPPSPDNPNKPTIDAINAATTTLNQTIAGAVAGARAAGIDITFVDVTTAFAGHGIGSADPFINATGPDAFHPNAAGYLAYAAALDAFLPQLAGQR